MVTDGESGPIPPIFRNHSSQETGTQIFVLREGDTRMTSSDQAAGAGAAASIRAGEGRGLRLGRGRVLVTVTGPLALGGTDLSVSWVLCYT